MTTLTEAKTVLSVWMTDLINRIQGCFAITGATRNLEPEAYLFLEAEGVRDVEKLPLWGRMTNRTYSRSQTSLGRPGRRKFETHGAVLFQVFAQLENPTFSRLFFALTEHIREGAFVFRGQDRASAEASRDMVLGADPNAGLLEQYAGNSDLKILLGWNGAYTAQNYAGGWSDIADANLPGSVLNADAIADCIAQEVFASMSGADDSGRPRNKLGAGEIDFPIYLDAAQLREGGVDGPFYRMTIEVPYRYDSYG